MKLIFKLWIFIVLFFILYAAYSIEMTVQYEQVHKAIFSSYGIPSHIEYLPEGPKGILFGVVAQTVSDYVPENESCRDNCILAQDLTEAIGYQLIAAVDAVWAIFFLACIFLLLFMRKEDKEKGYIYNGV